MIAGIDIGGSHITAALITEDTIELVPGSLHRERVDAHGTAEEIFDTWANAIQKIWSAHKLDATKIGIAMPGPFDYEKGIALMIGTDKYESLYKMNVCGPLAARLGIAPDQLKFRNDAEAFLLGEMMAGAGVGYNRAIGITLGTGLGSAVYKDGNAVDAARWQYPMYGTISEDHISTRFFVNRYHQLTGTTVKDARELAEKTTTDTLASEVFNDFCKNISFFLKEFIRDEQPEVIIIGGNIANAWSLIYPTLALEMADELKTVVIKKAALGEEAALIGGACCWLGQKTTI